MLKNEENMTELQQQQRDWVINYKDVKAFQTRMLGVHDQCREKIEEELSSDNESRNQQVDSNLSNINLDIDSKCAYSDRNFDSHRNGRGFMSQGSMDGQLNKFAGGKFGNEYGGD